MPLLIAWTSVFRKRKEQASGSTQFLRASSGTVIRQFVQFTGELSAGTMADFEQPALASSDSFDTDPDVWDIIIVGAGVAGATLAAVQGKVQAH